MSDAARMLLARLFDDGAQALALATPDGRCLRANAPFRQALALGDDAPLDGLDFARVPGWPALADPRARDASADLALPGAVRPWRVHATALELDGAHHLLLHLPDADALARARAERELFFALAPDLVALLDDTGRLHEANPAWTVSLGWDAAQLAGLPLAELVHEDDRERLDAALRGTATAADVLRARLRSRFGGWRWFEWTVCAFDDGRVYATARDVTGQMRARDALLRHRDELEARIAERTAELDGALARLRLHADTSPLATIEWNPGLRVSYWSRRATEMLGWRVDEVEGRAPREAPLFDPDAATAFEAQMGRLLRREAPRQSHVQRVRTRDGRTLACEWFDSAVFDANGEVASILSLVQDVTAREAAHEELEAKVAARTRELERLMAVLEDQARQDALTGLPNRRGLMERLPRALERSGRQHGGVVVMFVDLDRFKQVNDAHGHEAGDALLRETAARLMGCVRKTDIVARLGGDEFVVVLENVREPEAQAARVAEKIRRALAEPLRLSGSAVAISASIGVVVHAGDAVTPEDLIARADDGMYAAKRVGGDAVRLHPGMPADARAAEHVEGG